MVFKVGKGGVRSGNTLRGLNTARTKRYGRHACLLGYTSLGRRDLTRLVRDGSDDNQLVSDTLAKTDVLLSLNKQQRWRLPAMIGHMIKAGEFNKEAVVSLLEKHKLKRKANCVNLVSNNSRTSSITPKNNKYFTFSLDSVANEKSNRERRRDRVEQLKRLKMSAAAVRNVTKKNNNVIQTYTADGIPTAPTGMKSVYESEKPEYRLEVFYPCPRSCSLTYNPKYTDVVVAEGKTGELEVKSNVKTQKKGITTHRKRFTSRDMERLYSDQIDKDVDEMWDECDDDVDDNKENNDISAYYQHPDINSREYMMEVLLEQAKKTKDLCVVNKESISHNSKSKKRSKLVSISEEEKSHIVFVKKEGKEIESDHETKSVYHDVNSDNVTNENNVRSLDYFRVILSTSETDPEVLRRKYGTLYAEASCQPRRFVLDVTDDVTNLLATSKASTREINFSSYLVCVYDGFYDDGLAAYRVAFNSMVGCNDCKSLSEILPFTKMSIPDIMNTLACHLLDLKEKDCLEYSQRKIREVASRKDAEFLNSRMKVKVDVFDPSDEISKMAISSISENDGDDRTIKWAEFCTGMEDEDLFCDVCYVNVTSSKIDSVSGTRLKSCEHLLCDECWASHFRTGIRDGKTTMACGGYDCDTKAGVVTLISILNVSEVALLLKRRAEEDIETIENAKWCPHPDCGRVIKIDSKSQDLCVDVNCACGRNLCFSCMGPAHWPARCDQAEEYLDKLPSLAPAKEYVEEESRFAPFQPSKKSKKPEVVKVEGRLCPRCKKFIEKNGGCTYMVCKCGFEMCWTCMKPYHYSPCKPDHRWVLKHTKTLIVKHATAKELLAPDSQEPPKIQKNKQKASLYQRALQQREEIAVTTKYEDFSHISPLIKKAVRLSERDPQFKREIIELFSKNPQEIDDESLRHFDVRNRLKSFIKTVVEMKKELHRVREYTYILLQGIPHSVAKQRILKLANDLNGFCSFVTSILDLQDNQDPVTAFRRLVDLRRWAERALDALIRTTRDLGKE